MHKKRLALFGLITILTIGIPLTLYIFNKQQEIRSRAEKSTVLYFSPTSSTNNPLQTKIGETIPLDIMVNPGTNAVSLIKLELLYDQTKFKLAGSVPFQPNLNSFSQMIETPIFTPGKMTVTLSIGTDLSKIIQQTTRVGTIRLEALTATTPTNTPTSITYGSNTQVLSIEPNAGSYENVLSSTLPALISILPETAPTCSPRPTCLDTDPQCFIPEPIGGWCAPTTPTSIPTQTTTPTSTHTTTPIPTQTSTPTPAITTIPTTPPNTTTLKLNSLLDGIGSKGDNSNPNSTFSNKNPLHPQRNITIKIFDASSQLIASATSNMQYSSASGSFNATITLNQPITTGNYTIKATTDNHLTRLLPGIQTIIANQINNLPDANFIAGDINNDNKLDIRDYNMLINCYSDLSTPASCSDTHIKTASDLNDDGAVNQFDYNLFLREIAIQPGE